MALYHKHFPMALEIVHEYLYWLQLLPWYRCSMSFSTFLLKLDIQVVSNVLHMGRVDFRLVRCEWESLNPGLFLVVHGLKESAGLFFTLCSCKPWRRALKSSTPKPDIKFILKVKMAPTLENAKQCAPNHNFQQREVLFLPITDCSLGGKLLLGPKIFFNAQLNWCHWTELQPRCLQLCTIIYFTPERCFAWFLVLFPELWRWGRRRNPYPTFWCIDDFSFTLKETLAVGLSLLTSLGLRIYFDPEVLASIFLWGLLFKMSLQYGNSPTRKEQLVELKTQLMYQLWAKWNFVQDSSGPIPKAIGMTSRSCHYVKFWLVLKTWTRHTCCGSEDKLNWARPKKIAKHS